MSRGVERRIAHRLLGGVGNPDRSGRNAIDEVELQVLARARSMKLKVLIHRAEEGGYWAEVPSLPGCVSEGETFDEVLANIREAAEGWMEVAAERTNSEPDVQVVEVEL